MILYYILFVFPIGLLYMWNTLFTQTSEDRGFDMPNWVKIIFCIPFYICDITVPLLVSNAINEIIILFLIINKRIVESDLRRNIILCGIYEILSIVIMLILMWGYFLSRKKKTNILKDLILIARNTGEILSEDEEYSCTYEYCYNKHIQPSKVFVVLPDAMYTTCINGNVKAAPRYEYSKEKYNIGAYNGMSDELTLGGIAVLKLERVSSYVLEMCNGELVKAVISDILKKENFKGEIILFFHGENNRFIENIADKFTGSKIVSACNYFASNNDYRSQYEKLISEHKVLSIEAKYDPRIKRKFKKSLSNIVSSNHIYKYYNDMEFTLRERDKNTLNGGVDLFGRKLGDYELKDVYMPMMKDIIDFIS